MEAITAEVMGNKSNGQKFVYIPKRSKLKPGDFVKIIKVKFEEDEI